jgi:hypothetical protein
MAVHAAPPKSTPEVGPGMAIRSVWISVPSTIMYE